MARPPHVFCGACRRLRTGPTAGAARAPALCPDRPPRCTLPPRAHWRRSPDQHPSRLNASSPGRH
eukprot:10995292-Alexandrium_andersonii.AAC.1